MSAVSDNRVISMIAAFAGEVSFLMFGMEAKKYGVSVQGADCLPEADNGNKL